MPVVCAAELLPRVGGKGQQAKFLYAHHPMGSACRNGDSGATALLAQPGLQAQGVHLGKITGGQFGEPGAASFPIVGIGRHAELTAITESDDRATKEKDLLDSILLQLTRQHGNFFQTSLQCARSGGRRSEPHEDAGQVTGPSANLSVGSRGRYVRLPPLTPPTKELEASSMKARPLGPLQGSSPKMAGSSKPLTMASGCLSAFTLGEQLTSLCCGGFDAASAMMTCKACSLLGRCWMEQKSG